MKFQNFKLTLLTLSIAAISFYSISPNFAAELNSANHSKFDFQPSKSQFNESLCLVVKFSQGEPLRNLKNLSDLKVKWVRDTFPWDELEPKPGQWLTNFPMEFQQRLSFYREHNIGIIFLLDYGNSKAYPNTQLNPVNSVDAKLFANWAVRIAELLKASKVRFILEILNEPHNQLPQLLGGNWQGAAPSPWVDHYAQMVRETVAAVHAFDPNIKLLTDDDMWIVHYWFLEAGLPDDITGFAIHPYTGTGTPELTAVAYDTDWTRPFNVVDPDRSFRSAIRRLGEQGKNKLGKNPEIWITEWGWAVDGITNSIPEAVLAAYLPRAFILSAAAGVKTTCWFSSQDSVDGPMGLSRNDDSKRLSYFALRTLSKELENYILVQHIYGFNHPTTGIQGFLFYNRRARAKKLVIWNIDGKDKFITLPHTHSSVRAVNALGKPISIVKKSRSRSQIQVSAMPIYITGSFLENPTKLNFANIESASTDIVQTPNR
jgi:Cellulase (glycosyl hydrolase family 5)